MTTVAFDSDAARAAVTIASQQIAAYADKHAITITPAQCEDLAEVLVSHYQAFFAGVRYATTQRSTPEPGQ
ncbi:hypothetical protein [Phytohabitans kaempferiae]|uniref:PE domain-containing protein n=1 Tax=Phytohabitans kaempferiae TaxID=1620943 RepID=A0ABV6LYA3_9ACTN